jgi:hypothetical protein
VRAVGFVLHRWRVEGANPGGMPAVASCNSLALSVILYTAFGEDGVGVEALDRFRSQYDLAWHDLEGEAPQRGLRGAGYSVAAATERADFWVPLVCGHIVGLPAIVSSVIVGAMTATMQGKGWGCM